MLPLINLYQGNDSHVEYGNESNYNWTVACKSNITTIGNNCSGNYVNVAQLYNYTDSHISTNNYYSRAVCFNASGSLGLSWSVQTSAIGATPSNYECMFAIYNYSDAHVYDCNNTNASYNVNIRLAQGDLIPPTGSIVIYGPNGTEVTGTRNVFLNLTFNDSSGIGMCRWANDAESNLASQPWENCTTVKAWILSETSGNKTVYYQVNDTAGNTLILNDSIMYNYAQDYTPPTAPTVYDGYSGDDIDWWNSNDTLHAHWFNSSDDISNTVYYRYRILENSSCYNNDCNFTDVGEATSATATNLILKENWVYAFEVEAYNPFNISSRASSNGTRIDLTDPAAPIINSSTHPDQNLEYALSAAEFNWTAYDIVSSSNSSGIAGYSYLLDTSPGTAPDDVMEERYWQLLNPMRNDGFAQLLRGNASVVSPNTYAVFSQLHTNLTDGDLVKVRIALAERVSDYDDMMGVKVYLIRHANGVPVSLFDQESIAISNIENISMDIRYAADMTLSEIYTFNLAVNDTAADDTSDIYVVVSGLTSDSDNRNNLSIAGSTSSIDLLTWSFLCNNSNSCADTTSSVEYAVEVSKADPARWMMMYPGLADGTYYFHVKAKDVAGNWGDTSHYKITVAAGGVSVAIVSPSDGQIFTSDAASTNISVRVAVTGNASVRIVAKHPDGSTYTSQYEVFSTVRVFQNITLEQGTNEIYAVANTTAGAVTQSSSVYVIVARGEVPLTNKTLRIVYTGGGSVSGNPFISYQAQGANYVGIANEKPLSIAGGQIAAETYPNSIKIFMSKQFDANSVDDYFDDNNFLDQINPSFSYAGELKTFIVQNELRYDDVYISGDNNLQPGKYSLYITHNGVTPDGRVNLSIEVK
jgi:hypothetical protein